MKWTEEDDKVIDSYLDEADLIRELRQETRYCAPAIRRRSDPALLRCVTERFLGEISREAVLS